MNCLNCSKGETKPTSRIRIRDLKYINWLLDLNSMEQRSLMASQRMHFPWFSICESQSSELDIYE
jgi:hypothetical protein